MKKIFLLLLLGLAFLAAGAAAKPIRFALLCDLHVSPGNANAAALQETVELVNAEKYDFVIVAGDLTNRGEDAELMAVKQRLDRLDAPCRVIPGNHETNWSESAGQTFARLWEADRFVFDWNNVLFLGLSTGPDLKMGDGHVRAEDLIWLRQTLREKATPETPVILFVHYPLLDGHLSNHQQVTDILKQHRIIAVFGGHFHSNRHYNYDGIHGILGRALSMKNDSNPGFCEVELAGSKVKVTEVARLADGSATRKPLWEFDAADPGSLADLKASVPPPPSGGELPAGWRVEKILQADASVFTGLAFAPADPVFYYGTSTGELRSFDWQARRQLWSVDLGGAVFSTPLSGGELVIAGSVRNYLAAFHRNTGREVWRVAARAPVINDGLLLAGSLFMGLGREEFCQIDPATGQKIWSFQGVEGIFQASPAGGEGKIVFGAWDRQLYCLDAVTGKLLWKWNNNHAQKLFSPGNCQPVVADGKAVIVAPDRYMTAVSLATGEQLWRSNQYKFRESLGRSEADGVAYAKTMDGTLVAVATTGDEYRPLWEVDLKFGYEHNPCPNLEHGGILYAGSRAGVVAAVDVNTRRLLWTYRCGNSSVNRFAVAPDGAVWCTLIDGGIWRIAAP